MKNLPIGGVWKGKVKLHSNSPAQDYFANITLNTLDPNHIDVFFPEFAHATPRVQLQFSIQQEALTAATTRKI